MKNLVTNHAKSKALEIRRRSTDDFVDSLTGQSVCGYGKIPDVRLASMQRDAKIIIAEDEYRDFTDSIAQLVPGQAVRIWLNGTYAYRNLSDLSGEGDGAGPGGGL